MASRARYRVQFTPQLIGDRMLGQRDGLSEPFGARDANNRRNNPWITQRELKSGGSQWHIIARTGLLHLSGLPDQSFWRFVIHVTWIGARPLRQHATPVRSRIDGRNMMLLTTIPEWIGLTIEQGIAVMRNSHLKYIRFDKTNHEINWTTRHTQMGNQAFFLTLLQGLNRAAWLHRLLKRNMLRVMEIDELQLL